MRLAPFHLLVLITLLPPAAAQAVDVNVTALEPDLAPWVKERDLPTALFAATAGFLGALLVVFLVLRGDHPALANSLELRKRRLDIEADEEEYRKMRHDGTFDEDGRNFPAYITEKRTSFEREYRREEWTARIIYLLLGVGVAALFAQDLLQAIVFGAGGPAILAQTIAKRQAEKRADEKGRHIPEPEPPSGPPEEAPPAAAPGATRMMRKELLTSLEGLSGDVLKTRVREVLQAEAARPTPEQRELARQLRIAARL